KSNSFIDFQNNKKTKIGLTVYSDIINININSNIGITQPFKIKFDATIPYNSTISQIDKNIKLNAISKLNGLIVLNKNGKNHIYINSNELSLSCDYNNKRDRLNRGVLNISGEKIRFNGNFNKSINITTKIQNMNRFTKTIMKYYNIKLQKMRGKADINIKLNPSNTNIFLKSKKIEYGNIRGDLISKINIDKNSKIDIKLSSKEIRYIDETNKEPTKIHMLYGKFSILDNQIEIDRYSFRFYNDYISHFYSNRKSYLNLYNSTLYAEKVWLNDNILIRGDFNINSMVGNLNIVSNNFSFKNRDFDLLSKFKLNLEIDKERLFLSGLIEPIGNTIRYKAIGSGIEEDSDIIIVQNNSQKNSTILDNLKMNIRIKNQRPIRYITDNINIEFSNDITIIKDYLKDFKVLGTTTIDRGYYRQENKFFFLDKSYIYFSGNPRRPILEVKATYNKEQYNIQIFISGTTEDPIINFNSDPYLTQKEILSLILFDSTGENSGSGTEAYALLGGTFAKELMKSLGISIDHLVLGQGIDEQLSVEVGKKISKDITLIYQHNNGKDGVKVRFDHSRHLETDIILQPQSSSIELLYKSD
ncbi:MAG: translocation/assembly module TamB domain-containing protein, partial [Sulfurovaceae bacterium]|nr:translocation/assembly module TamB domain-containing protein [Sulfurovaceae bacterium]